MKRIKQNQSLTLKQAAAQVNANTGTQTISDLELVQHSMEGNLTLSLNFCSNSVPATPGWFVPLSKAQIRLSHIDQSVPYSDIQTRTEGYTGEKYEVQNGYLPERMQTAARSAFFGHELTKFEREALSEIKELFPDVPYGFYVFDVAGKRFRQNGHEFVFESLEQEGAKLLISGLWDITPYGDAKKALEHTFINAQINQLDSISSLKVPEECVLYLTQKDCQAPIEIDFAKAASSEEILLCVRTDSLSMLFKDDPIDLGQQHARPKAILEAQKEAILSTLRLDLNFNPQNLPKRMRGPHKGAKAQCWEIVKTNKQLFTYNSFNETWKKLRKDGELMGGE